jgi:hypothetical protein
MSMIDAISHAVMLALSGAAVYAILKYSAAVRARKHAKRAARTSRMSSDPYETARGYPSNRGRGGSL